MKKPNNEDAWSIYRRMFKEGEEVIVINDSSMFFYGKLKTNSNSVSLSRMYKHPIRIPFDEIAFMSHDGFPVSEYLIDLEPKVKDTKDVTKAMRLLFDNSDNNIDFKSKNQPSVSASFGCPWTISNVKAILHNSGNSVEKHPKFYDGDYQEVLEMLSNNGAQGLLWDLEAVFDFQDHSSGFNEYSGRQPAEKPELRIWSLAS